MIHVVTVETQHLYAHQLDQMFRMRHAEGVRGYSWNETDTPDGFKTDEFDDGEVVYLLSIGQFGQVAGSVRLNPSTGPNLLAGRLSEHLSAPPPQQADVWDMSQWFVVHTNPSGSEVATPTRTNAELACGVMEFARSRGVSAYTMVVETADLGEFQQHGWAPTPLGPDWTSKSKSGHAVALRIDAGEPTLAATRAAGQIFQNVLFEIRPQDSPEHDRKPGADTAAIQAGCEETQRTVLTLAQEIARLAEIDPAGSIAAIHEFQETLTRRLEEANFEPEAPPRRASN
ncbi:MAG: acyl-homoserine-lactone synthase [Pseudomonadota bacterium]